MKILKEKLRKEVVIMIILMIILILIIIIMIIIQDNLKHKFIFLPSDMDIHFMNVVSQIDLIQLIEMNSKKNDGLNNSPNAFYCGFLNYENKPSGG